MQSFKAALISMRRAPYQTLAAVLLLTVTSLVIFAFSFMLAGAQTILRHYEAQPEIIAFLQTDATPEEVQGLAATTEQRTYVKEVSVTSQDEALEMYKREYKDKPALLELVTASMLPASIEVRATDLDMLPQIQQDLEQSEIVDEVVFQQQVIDMFSQLTRNLRWIGLSSAGVLAALSFLIITIVISMKVSSQKNSIFIMRILGASGGYIKGPYMIEGLLYGVIGGLIGWTAVALLLLYFAPSIQSYVPEITLFPIPLDFYLQQLGIGVGSVMLLGIFAGYVASSRLIRR